MPTLSRPLALAIIGASSIALIGVALIGCTAPATPTVATPTASAGCPEGTAQAQEFCLADGALAGDLAATVRSAFEGSDAGAVIVGVYRHGDPIMTGALGESMTGTPATTDMHHRTGNLTWPMLTTVVLQQVDAGVLALDDPVSTWLPDLPGAEQATVEMLMNSTSGYAHYTQVQAFLDTLWEDPFRDWTYDELIAYGVGDGPLFEPGTDWHFSDTNAEILAVILEEATGRTVGELMQEGVLDPLGMTGTTLPTDMVINEPVLHGFSNERGVWEDVTSWNPEWTMYAGGLASNQEDLRRFLDALGTGELLSAESHEAQTAPITVGLAGNNPDRYWAMGLGVINDWYFLNPGFSGYFGAGATLPDEGWTIVVYTTTTREGSQTDAVATTIALLLSELLEPDRPITFG